MLKKLIQFEVDENVLIQAAVIYKDKGMEYGKKWCIDFLKEYGISN